MRPPAGTPRSRPDALAAEVLQHLASSRSFGLYAEELRRSQCCPPDEDALRQIAGAAKEVWGEAAELVRVRPLRSDTDFGYRVTGLLNAASLEEMHQLRELCTLMPGVHAHPDICAALRLRLQDCAIEVAPDEASYFKPEVPAETPRHPVAEDMAVANAMRVLKRLFQNVIPGIMSWCLEDLVRASCSDDCSVALDTTGRTLFLHVLRVMRTLISVQKLSFGCFVLPHSMASLIDGILAEHDETKAARVLQQVRLVQQARLDGELCTDSNAFLGKGLVPWGEEVPCWPQPRTLESGSEATREPAACGQEAVGAAITRTASTASTTSAYSPLAVLARGLKDMQAPQSARHAPGSQGARGPWLFDLRLAGGGVPVQGEEEDADASDQREESGGERSRTASESAAASAVGAPQLRAAASSGPAAAHTPREEAHANAMRRMCQAGEVQSEQILSAVLHRSQVGITIQDLVFSIEQIGWHELGNSGQHAWICLLSSMEQRGLVDIHSPDGRTYIITKTARERPRRRSLDRRRSSAAPQEVGCLTS